MFRVQTFTALLCVNALLVLLTLCGTNEAHAQPVPTTPIALTNPGTTTCIQPLGKYDRRLLKITARGVQYLYGFNVRVLPARKMPRAAYYRPRRRWRGDTIIDHLREEVFPGSSCTMILGFTSEDISTTKGEHYDWGVLGLAELGGVAGVVSSFRTGRKLRRPHTRARRLVKTFNHEIGHLLGLPHLKGTTCLMNDAEGSVLSSDRESGLLCAQTIRWIEANRKLKIPRHATFDWSVVEGPSRRARKRRKPR